MKRIVPSLLVIWCLRIVLAACLVSVQLGICLSKICRWSVPMRDWSLEQQHTSAWVLLGLAAFLVLPWRMRAWYQIVISCLLACLCLGAAWKWPKLSCKLRMHFVPPYAAWAGKNADESLFARESHQLLAAITFDDGPTDATVSLLEVLAQEGVPATFFINGRNIEGREQLLQQMVAQGCEIGNHTWSHVPVLFRSEEEVCREFERTTEAVEAITGIRPRYCRPPWGDMSPERAALVRSRCGLKAVFWTNWSGDGSCRDDDRNFQCEFSQQIPPVAILLHHDHGTSPALLQRVIAELRARGYRMVTVSELERCSRRK